MIAGQNGDRNGAARPLWITGLSPPDSWRSLRQPGTHSYTEPDTPNTASGGTTASLECLIFDC